MAKQISYSVGEGSNINFAIDSFLAGVGSLTLKPSLVSCAASKAVWLTAALLLCKLILY